MCATFSSHLLETPEARSQPVFVTRCDSLLAQAVGNTVKRVVIIIAGTIVFNKPLTQQGIIGSSVAIGGVLLYSLVKAQASAPKAKKA